MSDKLQFNTKDKHDVYIKLLKTDMEKLNYEQLKHCIKHCNKLSNELMMCYQLNK